MHRLRVASPCYLKYTKILLVGQIKLVVCGVWTGKQACHINAQTNFKIILFFTFINLLQKIKLLKPNFLDPSPCQQLSNFFKPSPYFVEVINGQPLYTSWRFEFQESLGEQRDKLLIYEVILFTPTNFYTGGKQVSPCANETKILLTKCTASEINKPNP